MQRRQILAGLLAAVAMPTAALAQTAEEQVIDQLKRQGYRRITLGSTLLGRRRIVATGPRGRREIILNPATGAILRDYLDRSDRGGSRDNRDDDREDRDDDREDRNDDRDDRDDDRDDRDDDRDDRDDDRDDRDDDRGGGDNDDDDDDDDD
ncbi:MAG: hypothetical protein R6V30_07305 [Paracoccaceae bacterium]